MTTREHEPSTSYSPRDGRRRRRREGGRDRTISPAAAHGEARRKMETSVIRCAYWPWDRASGHFREAATERKSRKSASKWNTVGRTTHIVVDRCHPPKNNPNFAQWCEQCIHRNDGPRELTGGSTSTASRARQVRMRRVLGILLSISSVEEPNHPSNQLAIQ